MPGLTAFFGAHGREGRTDAGVMALNMKWIGPDAGVIPFEKRPVFGMENENRLWTWDVRGRKKTDSSI